LTEKKRERDHQLVGGGRWSPNEGTTAPITEKGTGELETFSGSADSKSDWRGKGRLTTGEEMQRGPPYCPSSELTLRHWGLGGNCFLNS